MKTCTLKLNCPHKQNYSLLELYNFGRLSKLQRESTLLTNALKDSLTCSPLHLNLLTISLHTLSSLDKIDPVSWNKLALGHPFMNHAFLHGLAETGCVGKDTGWQQIYLIATEDKTPPNTQGTEPSSVTLCGAAACYFKFHSYGEYVFDHAWADAWQRAGGQYYPKLICAAPFTPATGPRLMTHPELSKETQQETQRKLAQGLVAFGQELKLSSCHLLFTDPSLTTVLRREGWEIRNGLQYHWFNRDYENYEAFLNTLTSRRRKDLRKERRRITDGPVSLKMRHGSELSHTDWDRFFMFYQDTSARKWGSPYLTRSFFDYIGDAMAEDIRMVWGTFQNEAVCGALNFVGSSAIYGRYWGALAHLEHLHFEACYHQAIDYAIAHKLERVEAGAQGEHKIKRGYEPVLTTSAHWIYNDSFREAVSHFIHTETQALKASLPHLSSAAGYSATRYNAKHSAQENILMQLNPEI